MPPCEPANEPKPHLVPDAADHLQARPPVSTVNGESWPTTGSKKMNRFTRTSCPGYTFTSPFTGCDLLPFQPVDRSPRGQNRSQHADGRERQRSPSRRARRCRRPNSAEAAIKDTTLQLPAGMTAGGGAANGLEACDAGQLGFNGLRRRPHPAARKRPLHAQRGELPGAREGRHGADQHAAARRRTDGSVYLAKRRHAPVHLAARALPDRRRPISGVDVKLAGKVEIDETTGQLTSKFADAPPLPFSELELHLFDGDRATQSTPARCGTYKPVASFLASSSTPGRPGRRQRGTRTSRSPPAGREGGACPGGPAPFAPQLQSQPCRTPKAARSRPSRSRSNGPTATRR